MAPFAGSKSSAHSARHHAVHRWRRHGSATGGSNGGPVRRANASSASTTSPSVYLGLGIGVGGAILIAIIIVVVQIARKRREHRRLIEALEVQQAVRGARGQEIGEVPRPITLPRCSALSPLQARGGWDALSSDEAVNGSETVAHGEKRKKRSSVSLPKRFKSKGIPLKRLKRLTAIMESPRSRSTTKSPALPFGETMPSYPGTEQATTSEPNPKAYTLRMVDNEDVFVCPGSPKPEILPSFAIRSPGRYGAGIAMYDNPKASRSRSVGALEVPVPARAFLKQVVGLSQQPMHMRSVSLGAPPTRPPSCPVPPLPNTASRAIDKEPSARQGVCISRSSTSSQESAGSSVLVTSPILKMHDQNKPLSSPSVEDVVAEDDSASLKTVSAKQWKKVASKQRPRGAHDRDGSKSQASIRSNIARYSEESPVIPRVSPLSSSPTDKENRLSIPHVGLADQVSISRVSSTDSLRGYSGIKKVTTPRRASRTSVSATGSPAQRKKTGVLRDISGNSTTPARKASTATEESGRSSNGNPFQWDQPLLKPSALKGSPNARKGHRRQNCVRISTLTPQILGPPPSRPTSPSIMHGIEEESGDGEEAADTSKLRFVSNQRLSRPPSASSFEPNLRIRTLRASLTPSSPTLSAWTAYQENGLPSQHSDSQLSVSPLARSNSRQSSDRSSAFSIPSFPSPIKATVSAVQLNQPMPEFCVSTPSTDIDENEASSPFGGQENFETDVPSSPPLPVSKHEEYDPAWPRIDIPAPKTQENDPASPSWVATEPEKSSPFFAFAANPMNEQLDEAVSTYSLTSYGGELPDTPPCSPKTMPEGFQAFFDKQDSGSKPTRAAEKLTSANASDIMARMPSKHIVDFPGAPVLSPPEQPEEYSQITPSRPIPIRQRAVSNIGSFQPMRPAPPPPAVTSSEYDMPSPLHISGKTSPRGPRTQPAQSVLKNAMALRRMNSEVNNTPHRESRRYVRLGREASPLLPWIGTPDPNESCGDMNELFDFGFASAGAEEGAEEYKSALDDIDMTEVEQIIDGALAGFAAPPGSDDTVREQQKRSSSVWEDGEKYWTEQSPQISVMPSSPLAMDVTPQKPGSNGSLAVTPRTVQFTPKSLYDSDGFLRT
ncbi:hypothetical protein LTR37_017097 [Vermiconidia calcicola]|uniref:Uncharacterized protein n=1 Tax=Vermiconidia calcicola TaxID=1690605 RepID=A0ACC3MLR8_9PEZI|nr:hypothetical protein LTR37_017097 [Vermiconidia calcicola]